MEAFLTTLPPYVHQYINKYPATECFTVLKDLICFAVLYSNDRERINHLSLELLQKGADSVVQHKPYIASELAPSLTSTASTALTSPIPSAQRLSPASANRIIPSPTHSASHLQHIDLDCSRVIMEEPEVFSEESIAVRAVDETVSSSPAANSGRKSTMPYTFPEWWAHPDSGSNDHHGPNNHVEKHIGRSETVLQSNQVSDTSKQLTTTQEMNITNWIPIDFAESTKASRHQTTPRPASLYNPTIPDLRSYLGKTEQAANKNLQVVQGDGSTAKASSRMSVPAAPAGTPMTPTLSKSKQFPKQTVPLSCSPPPTSSSSRLLTKSISSNTASAIKNKAAGASIPLSRSSSTRSAASTSTTTATSSSKAYRPGQTATVRARAEQAKQRQLQLEEEKRKQASSTLTSRTSLRLRQQAASGIDWEAIKKDRRKTMPASGYGN